MFDINGQNKQANNKDKGPTHHFATLISLSLCNGHLDFFFFFHSGFFCLACLPVTNQIPQRLQSQSRSGDGKRNTGPVMGKDVTRIGQG